MYKKISIIILLVLFIVFLGEAKAEEKLPDLTIIDATFSPNTPEKNVPFTGTLRVTIKNIGEVATTNGEGIRVNAAITKSNGALVNWSGQDSLEYIDNLSADSLGLAILELNNVTIDTDSITLKVWVDNAEQGGAGFIEESNENNNTLTKTIAISEKINDTHIEKDEIIEEQEEGETDNSTIDDSDNNDNSGADNSITNQLILQLQRQISALEKQVIELEKKLTVLDQKFADKYKGTMFLDVENHGRLWYVDPASKNRFYFENGEAALSIGSKLATGITYEDIQKIPVGVPDKLYNLKDSDGDGLPDRLESALGSDPNNSDSDGDGFSDKQEIENGYNPVVDQKYNYDQNLIERLEGKMLLQVSGPNSHGEIWYIKDGQRWYGGTEDSMYEIMKARSLGATPDNIRKIAVGEIEGIE